MADRHGGHECGVSDPMTNGGDNHDLMIYRFVADILEIRLSHVLEIRD